MATVSIAYSGGMQGYPVPSKAPTASHVITSSGTSQAATAATRTGDIAVVTVSGGNVWVKIGATPTAASGDEWLVLDGQTREFGPVVSGDAVAVIDA